jgi:hypothetical protein
MDNSKMLYYYQGVQGTAGVQGPTGLTGTVGLLTELSVKHRVETADRDVKRYIDNLNNKLDKFTEKINKR